MGGSLACEPARLAGEWAGQFGKLARGKRGWTLDSGQCTRRIHRQMMLLCCTAVHKKTNGVLQTKPLQRSQYHKVDCTLHTAQASILSEMVLMGTINNPRKR